MKLCCVLLSLMVWGVMGAQGPVVETSQKPQDTPAIRLTFSEPDLDSPIAMPSAAMGGAPLCGPSGVSFIKFLTPPPYYFNTTVYSIFPEGKAVRYPTEQMLGLKNIRIVFLDPGMSNAAFLLSATSADDSRQSPESFYLALFDYEGKLQQNTRLDLGFYPIEVVQLSDDLYLVSGADRASATPRFALMDDRGVVRRSLSEDAIMPSSKEFSSMLSSMSFVGRNPNDMAPSDRLTALLSLFHPVHWANGILILEPGAGAHVVEVLPSGEVRTVKLKLRPNEAAQSMMTSKAGWFVRTSVKDKETVSDLIQVDPETGETIRRFDTGGVPATSIACATDSGFYGFRWIDHKPYVISADMR